MPTRDHVKKAMAAMKTGADYDYFFDRLSSPDWIQPLLDEGVLKRPPPPRVEGEGTWHPIWSGSKYLARMAHKNPDLVRKTIAAIPTTENVRVHEDFVDAALAMSPSVASQLVKQAGEWIKSGPYFLLPQKLGKLVVHLAKGGEVDSAFELAESLSALKPGERIALADAEDIFHSTEAEPLFDAWDYGEILRTIEPALSQTDAERALQLFSTLLDKALLLASGRKEQPSKPTEDLSYVWRPAIEDHEENWRGDAKDHLVVAVRDSSIRVLEDDASLLTSLVPALLARPWRVYHRIAIHLLDRFGEIAPELVRDVLTNQDLLDELGVRHEFALLMQHRFGELKSHDQSEVLRLITEGFDEGEFRRRYEAARESPPTEDEVREYEAFRRRDGLWLIGRDALPPDRREELDGLIAQLGTPDRPAAETSFSQSWVGPTSPKDSQDLGAMDAESIVGYLKGWKPPDGHMVPTPEGLGRVLSAVVAEEPDRFARDALLFKELDPTYVRGLLSGLREGLKQKKNFDWKPIVELCAWISQQPRDIPGRTGEYMDLDPGWVWARKATADLLADGFSKAAAGPSLDLRGQCWAALEPLTQDPEPDSDYEAKYGGENMDPSHLSINTVRGQAMHATVFYLLWVRRMLVEQGQEFSITDAPEARRVLEARLDVAVDPALTVRAVYGWHFPRLHLLDSSWSASLVERIFPIDAESTDHFDAAWGAYVLFNPAIKEVVDVLRDVYSAAISRMATTEPRESRLHDPDEHLADHLMSLYWRGHEVLGADTLIEQFYTTAPNRLRRHALVFVGRSLLDVPEISEDVRDRLTQLWNWRLEQVDEDSQEELIGFGWWFASSHFDGEWLLDQLERVLRQAKGIDPRHLVAERLVALVDEHPRRVVECLRLFIETADKPWDVYGIRDEAMTILNRGITDPDKTTIELARGVVHSLGARGFREFRQLLVDGETADHG